MQGHFHQEKQNTAVEQNITLFSKSFKREGRCHAIQHNYCNFLNYIFQQLLFQETQWDYTTNRDLRSINLHPSPLLISKAYKAMVESFGWKSLTILYQDNHGLLRLQELIKSPLQPNTKIVLRKFSFGEGEDNISKVLLEVKQSGAIHVVLDCDQDKIREVLSKAQEVGIVTFLSSYHPGGIGHCLPQLPCHQPRLALGRLG